MQRRSFLKFLATLPVVGLLPTILNASKKTDKPEYIWDGLKYLSHSITGDIYLTKINEDGSYREEKIDRVCWDEVCYPLRKQSPYFRYISFPVENKLTIQFQGEKDIFEYQYLCFNLAQKVCDKLRDPKEVFLELNNPNTRWKLAQISCLSKGHWSYVIPGCDKIPEKTIIGNPINIGVLRKGWVVT